MLAEAAVAAVQTAAQAVLVVAGQGQLILVHLQPLAQPIGAAVVAAVMLVAPEARLTALLAVPALLSSS